MRYKPGQKEETRKKITEAAGRTFKRCGYSGVGVDGLAKEAGVTSGAFYGHFKSKEEAFKQAISAGMGDLASAIAEYKNTYGDDWWDKFADFYTLDKRVCDLSQSCALQSMTPEVGRSNESIRQLFSEELLKVVETANGKEDRDKVWVRLAMLIGGVTLARAVGEDALALQIAEAVNKEVKAISRQS